MTDRLTILFNPESAYGPTNNCIGIGKVLERRGHRVVFAAESSWRGRLEPLGFEEDLVDLAPPPEDAAEQDAGQFWTDFITQTAPSSPSWFDVNAILLPSGDQAGSKACHGADVSCVAEPVPSDLITLMTQPD